MAYKSNGGCAPITAKIKRTTQGGMITQPLLDMGAPVKMKMSSPAKQTNAQDFSSQYEAQQKAKADQKAKAIKAKKEKDVASYNQRLDSYRSNVLSLDSDTKRAASNKNPKEMDILMRAANRKSKNIQKFEKNLFDYDTKKNPSLTEGYTAREYALAKAKGTYKAKNAKSPETENTTSSGDGGATTTTTTTDEKKYNTSMKNFKIGSQARRDEYTRRGWKQDDTTKVTKKTAETAKKTDATTKATTTNNKKSTNTKNSKGTEGKKYDLTNVTGSTGYQIKQKAKEIGGKISNAAKIAKAKKLAADAKRKTSKVAKKQAQADAAIAVGNTKKAARKQKAADRKTRKATKKSQAAKAIQPK